MAASAAIEPSPILDVLDARHLAVKKLLGRGGFASVYTATYKGMPVALKVLEEKPARMPECVRMLLREAACYQEHQHEHMVECVGVMRIPGSFPGLRSSSDWRWGMVLELCETFTTKTLIVSTMSSSCRAYTELQAYEWLAQIASALAHLHTRNPPVIHRDIKHENVLLKQAPEGKASGGKGRLVAKLADLGLLVTLQQDRSVMLRRRTSGLSTRSMHGRLSRGTSLAGGIAGISGAAAAGGSMATTNRSRSRQPTRSGHGVGGDAEGDGSTFYTLSSPPASVISGPDGAAGSSTAGPHFAAAGSLPSGPVEEVAATGAEAWPSSAAHDWDGESGADITLYHAQDAAEVDDDRAMDGKQLQRAEDVSAAAPQSADARAEMEAADADLVKLKKTTPVNTGADESVLAPPSPSRQVTFAAAAAPDPLRNSDVAVLTPGLALAGDSSAGIVTIEVGPMGCCQVSGVTSCLAARKSAVAQDAGDFELRVSPAMQTPGPRNPKPTVVGAAPTDSGGGSTATASAASAGGFFVSAAGTTAPLGHSPADCVKGTGNNSSSSRGGRVSSETAAPFLISMAASAPAAPIVVGPRLAASSAGGLLTVGSSRPYDRQSPSASRPPLQPSPVQPSLLSLQSSLRSSSPTKREKQQHLQLGDPGPQPTRAIPSVASLQDSSCRPKAATAGSRASSSMQRTPASGVRSSRERCASSVAPTTVAAGEDEVEGDLRASALVPRAAVPLQRMLTNSELVKPVDLDGPVDAGLRRVNSVLRQFQQTMLPQLRDSSVEWVFGLTGRAGSCMYMAPEVFCKLPYNEKADVFSFGVLMYELLARELLIITYFNTSKGARLGVKQPEDYARKVCEGYRPPRPTFVSDPAWALIEACWHDDPVQRPTMEQVLERLTQLRDQEAAGPTDTRAMAGCTAGCVVQ